MEKVVVLVSNDVVLLTRDDSADGVLFSHPSFRREVGSVSGRWDFWAVGVFGHGGKGVSLLFAQRRPIGVLVFVSKWFWCSLVW